MVHLFMSVFSISTIKTNILVSSELARRDNLFHPVDNHLN